MDPQDQDAITGGEADHNADEIKSQSHTGDGASPG